MGGDTARCRTRNRSGTVHGKVPRDRPVGMLSDCVVHLYLWCTHQGAGCRRAPLCRTCRRGERVTFECALWRSPGDARSGTTPFLEIAGPARSATGIALEGCRAGALRDARIHGTARNRRSVRGAGNPSRDSRPATCVFTFCRSDLASGTVEAPLAPLFVPLLTILPVETS